MESVGMYVISLCEPRKRNHALLKLIRHAGRTSGHYASLAVNSQYEAALFGLKVGSRDDRHGQLQDIMSRPNQHHRHFNRLVFNGLHH